MKKLLAALALTSSLAAQATELPASAVLGAEHAPKDAVNPKEIVFIHGMFVTPKCWDAWLPYFRERGYKVSAPAWPGHEGTVEEARAPERLEALGKLELQDVLARYRDILGAKRTQPILVGHSMGGLVAQILLQEGLGSAAVAIDSAPPLGVVTPSWSFVRANWGALNLLAAASRPIELSFEQFAYAFVNAQPPEAQRAAFDQYYVPESRQVGRAPLKKVGRVKKDQARGPLLIVAGGADHIIPAKLNHQNFRHYAKAPAYTEFALFEGRDHWTIGAPGWESVAAKVDEWLKARFPK